MSSHLPWTGKDNSLDRARDEAECALFRMTAQLPICFTRVLLGGDAGPHWVSGFVSGSVTDADAVKRTAVYREALQQYPEIKEWPALCTVCVGRNLPSAIGSVSACAFDLEIMNRIGDRFLKEQGVQQVYARQMIIPTLSAMTKPGKGLPTASWSSMRYPLPQGSRSLTAADLDVQERISVEDERINFRLDIFADERSAFGRQLSSEEEGSYIQAYTSYTAATGQVDNTLDIVVRSPGGDEWSSCILTDETRELLRQKILGNLVRLEGPDDWINLYADYDCAEKQVCDVLSIELHHADGRQEELAYPLNAAEKTVLFRKMDAYCQQETGQTLNALAMFDLGRISSAGIGQDPDEPQAQAWYAKALAAFRAVEKGRSNRYAEYRIGRMYAAGLGVELDCEAAALWFEKSSSQNYAPAQYSLAKLYSEGHGVERDYRMALRLYEQAAMKGFPYAVWELGKLYRDGVGTRPDDRQATRYFASAFRGFQMMETQSHDDKHQYRLGWMLLHGIGTERNESAARKWFERSVARGNENAQYQLAKLILGSDGSTPEEISQAVDWLKKLAEANSEPAQYMLGKLYRDGGAVKRNDVLAAIWFSHAAEQGHEYAMYALGKLDLEAGNASAACRWFEKAAELGNPFAQYQLGKLLLTGEAKDIERALRWLTASAEQGNQFAQYALGKLYLLGRDIPQDKDAAVRWFTQAAEQGNEYAQYFLDHINDPQGPPLLTNATRLLHHMSRIFRDEAPPSLPGISFVDSKLRRRIREKKIAMGHKPDDHEDQGIAMR